MSTYNTLCQLKQKIDAEGGLDYFIRGYGIAKRDLPERLCKEVYPLFEAAFDAIIELEDKLNAEECDDE